MKHRMSTNYIMILSRRVSISVYSSICTSATVKSSSVYHLYVKIIGDGIWLRAICAMIRGTQKQTTLSMASATVTVPFCTQNAFVIPLKHRRQRIKRAAISRFQCMTFRVSCPSENSYYENIKLVPSYVHFRFINCCIYMTYLEQ